MHLRKRDFVQFFLYSVSFPSFPIVLFSFHSNSIIPSISILGLFPFVLCPMSSLSCFLVSSFLCHSFHVVIISSCFNISTIISFMHFISGLPSFPSHISTLPHIHVLKSSVTSVCCLTLFLTFLPCPYHVLFNYFSYYLTMRPLSRAFQSCSSHTSTLSLLPVLSLPSLRYAPSHCSLPTVPSW